VTSKERPGRPDAIQQPLIGMVIARNTSDGAAARMNAAPVWAARPPGSMIAMIAGAASHRPTASTTAAGTASARASVSACPCRWFSPAPVARDTSGCTAASTPNNSASTTP
jgi:hypothetical protein